MNQQAITANERAGRVELEAAEQREKAAKAERELLELQQRLAPRRLQGEQIDRFINALKNGPTVPINLVASISDQEAVDWANQLAALFSQAGWTVASNGVGPFSGSGVVLMTKEEHVSAGVQHLIRAFATVGVNVGHQVNANQAHELSVLVLSKLRR
jgi:hypothetical protein